MQWKIRKYLEVSPAFVALLCAYFYFDPAETFLPFLLAVTLHEAGHLLALRCMRVQVHKVSFQLTGAVIHTQPLRYPQEGLAAAAGPLVNLLCTLVFLHKNPAFALVNLLLLFFNLLPLYPLDGGRILRALLHMLLNDAAACIAEKLISGVCLTAVAACAVYLTCVWHAGPWPILLCVLLILRAVETSLPPSGRRARI